MLLKFLLFLLPILVIPAPQDPAGAAATAAKGQVSGGGGNDFDCICRPIPGSTNNEFQCKCHSAAAGTPVTAGSIDAPNQSSKVPPPPGITTRGVGPGLTAAPLPVGTFPPNGTLGPDATINDADIDDALQKESGNAFSAVLCVKKPLGAPAESKPAYIFLERKGAGVHIAGQWWEYAKCSYGEVQPFLINDDAYKAVLQLCKAQGYDVAQPGDDKMTGWYTFQISQDLAAYYHQTNSPNQTKVTYDFFPQTPADKCGEVAPGLTAAPLSAGIPPNGTVGPSAGTVLPANGTGTESPNNDADNDAALQTAFGNTFSAVLCAKNQVGAAPGSQPAFIFLQKNGKDVHIFGQKSRVQCKYGVAEPFLVFDPAYKAVTSMCKAQGYNVAQPGDEKMTSLYPFKVVNDITAYYRKTNSSTYNLIPQSPQDTC